MPENRDLQPRASPADADEVLAPVVLDRQWELVTRWTAWLDEQVAQHQLAAETRTGYRETIRYWLAFLERDARTDQPTPATIQQYVTTLIAAELKPATINFYLNVVKSFYRWCESGDHYPAIGRSIRTIREYHDGPLPALSHNQIVALVKLIPEDTLGHIRDRALLSLMYATAFRCISVVRADIDDVDLDRCTIAHQPKGHLAKDTAAIIPRSVADILTRYLDRRRAEIGIPSEPLQPLFIALDRRCAGRRMTAKSIRYQVLTYMELAGHAKRREDGTLVHPRLFSAHSIRRSASVTTADAAGLEVAQGLLGHASIETTRKAYARVSLERRLRENAKRLDSL